MGYRPLLCFTGALLMLVGGTHLIILPDLAKERVITSAVQAARVELQAAPQVIFSGPRNAIAEFYAGRPLHVIGDSVHAWARAGSGDVVILVSQGKPPVAPSLPVPARYRRVGERMRCDIVIKP